VTTLPEHIATFLGKLEDSWHLETGSHDLQVVKASNQPAPGVTAYATLGMSHAVLRMPGGRTVRQELVLAAYERFPPASVASFLLTFGASILSLGEALLRGDMIGPQNALIPGVAANSIYCTAPVPFDERLATYDGSEPLTVFVWALPVTGDEAEFVMRNGWSKFEELLESREPDLWDLNRPSVV
jgi:antitoxin YqcF